MKNTITKRWATKECFSIDCWCEAIVVEETLNDEEPHYVVSYGSVSKEEARHIVEIHNKSLNNE